MDTFSYIKKVQFLLMYMFKWDQVVANYTVTAPGKNRKTENVTLFWTKPQKDLIDSKHKRVLFTSEYGTGKTTLLKAKAKQLSHHIHSQHLKSKAKQIGMSTGKIFFVVFTGQDTLLFQSLKSEMEELKHQVQILSLTGKFKLCKH